MIRLAVTGTDTGVGKTVFSAALLVFLRQHGLRVAGMKPVETGVVAGDVHRDAEVLRAAAAAGDAIDDVCPVALPEPLAPLVAAEHATHPLDLEAEPAGRPRPLSLGPHPPEPAHQQGVGNQCLGPVDQRVEDLVVARGRHVEALADRGLLGPAVLPPLALELEDPSVALVDAELALRVRLRVSGVHRVSPWIADWVCWSGPSLRERITGV